MVISISVFVYTVRVHTAYKSTPIVVNRTAIEGECTNDISLPLTIGSLLSIAVKCKKHVKIVAVSQTIAWQCTMQLRKTILHCFT